MFLYEILVNLMPIAVASWDSGFYGIDQSGLRAEIISRLEGVSKR